jgi:hypothetical protein
VLANAVPTLKNSISLGFLQSPLFTLSHAKTNGCPVSQENGTPIPQNRTHVGIIDGKIRKNLQSVKWFALDVLRQMPEK